MWFCGVECNCRWVRNMIADEYPDLGKRENIWNIYTLVAKDPEMFTLLKTDHENDFVFRKRSLLRATGLLAGLGTVSTSVLLASMRRVLDDVATIKDDDERAQVAETFKVADWRTRILREEASVAIVKCVKILIFNSSHAVHVTSHFFAHKIHMHFN